MRNGNSWRLLPLRVPVADTEREEKVDRLKLTKGHLEGDQAEKAQQQGRRLSALQRQRAEASKSPKLGRVCRKEGRLLRAQRDT